ncbi:hypothetical protein Ct61P_14530 [Colletotrichum tofieldiae]|nr:hypothetical protein Ct61P_14530 [Colletotrichum tofieldiae]
MLETQATSRRTPRSRLGLGPSLDAHANTLILTDINADQHPKDDLSVLALTLQSTPDIEPQIHLSMALTPEIPVVLHLGGLDRVVRTAQPYEYLTCTPFGVVTTPILSDSSTSLLLLALDQTLPLAPLRPWRSDLHDDSDGG